MSAKINNFCAQHQLPASFAEVIDHHYAPLAHTLPKWRTDRHPLVLGINGAQGTGKTTLAAYLAMATADAFGWRSAVMSIDDFYLTHAERAELGRQVHPLLATRGVPGTHDHTLLRDTLHQLLGLKPGQSAQVPRFDKSTDDRHPRSEWQTCTGTLDLIVLEGWCVGSTAQTVADLEAPINQLEQQEDRGAHWRHWVNQQLKRHYEPLFGELQALILLAAPSYAAVYRWRLEQEQKLAARHAGRGVMGPDQLARFIQHYERLTRHNLATLPQHADAVFYLDEAHNIAQHHYRGTNSG